MEKYDSYKKIIYQALNNDVQDITLASATNNIVFKVLTKNNGTLFAKFYLDKSSHIDNEMKLYALVNNKYLKEALVLSNSPKFAIYNELKGVTLDELSEEQLEQNTEKIVSNVINFFEEIGKNKVSNYGILNVNLCGTSKNFKDFIISRQTDTQNYLKESPFLYGIFEKIMKKYGNLLIADNSLVPIDTNMKNIMLTENEEIKFIDPGELISAPILMGYGDFVAHTYKTKLYDSLMTKLSLNDDDEKRLRIYAIFSSLNILAFLKRNGVDELDTVIPFGNKYTFYSLIAEHLKKLDIN